MVAARQAGICCAMSGDITDTLIHTIALLSRVTATRFGLVIL
jgi:hypothetical protein